MFTGHPGGSHRQLRDSLSVFRQAFDLQFVMHPGEDAGAVVQALLTKQLVELHDPLLGDQGSGRLQKRIQGCVGVANVQLPPIQTDQVALSLGLSLDGIYKLAQSGQAFQEAFPEDRSCLPSFADNCTNLGVTGSV